MWHVEVDKNLLHRLYNCIAECFFEILASTYGSGPYDPGPVMILKNILS